ncbi:MAG: hypothetical protein ACOCYA_01025, partial [Spirochaetota bacterium]
FVGRKGNRINTRFLMTEDNQLPRLLENEDDWADIIKVIDLPEGNGKTPAMYLNANALHQRTVLYVE